VIASERTKKHSLPRSTNRLQIQDLDKALSLIPGKYRLPIKQPNPVEILQLMLLVREGDRRESSLMRQGKGCIHIPGMGHEPLAVLSYHLRREDYLFTYYRDRSLMIARGMTPQQFANDYFASAKSSTGGRGMPVHSSSKSLNIFPPATPTGSQCLPAVGAAWGIKMANQDGVVICTIGDASVRQGEFYEAACFAVQEQLPIVFVIEDNAYGISTPTFNQMPFRLGIFSEQLFVKVNGRDPLELFVKGAEAIGHARLGLGPAILWCEFDRLMSHTNSDDHRVYRTQQELEAITKHDPIVTLANQLMDSGTLALENWQVMQDETARLIDDIYLAAEKEAPPDPATILEHLYGSPVKHLPWPASLAEQSSTMVGAVNHILRIGLEKYPRMIMFGEDIEDPKGGVFGFTKGLSRQFPGRIFNSPLAEATIVGTAVGLAATGYKPVFELQFIDFLTPGFNQLVQQVTTLRWRSNGDWACPMVLYAPYGAYLPGGSTWHSQSNEGWWAHSPGIRVAIPSTPADAVGLFWAALQDEDPSLILLPKHIFRMRMRVEHHDVVPFGKAAIRREGRDVTVVSWGNCLELANKAAVLLATEGISLEIIDLRTLVPCDWQTIETSLAKTGRLVVINEDNRTCSFGQAIITEMTATPQRFNCFLSPPQLVARADVHIPYHPVLEYAVLPNVERVIQAIRVVMD
jgi:2-oxoisovalerate dehydrogenase E1 component